MVNHKFHEIIVHRYRFIPKSRHFLDDAREVLGCLHGLDLHIQRLEELFGLLAQLLIGVRLTLS